MSKQLNEFWPVARDIMSNGEWFTCLRLANRLPSLALKRKYQYKISSLLSRMYRETKVLERVKAKQILFKSGGNKYYKATHSYRIKPELLKQGITQLSLSL